MCLVKSPLSAQNLYEQDKTLSIISSLSLFQNFTMPSNPTTSSLLDLEKLQSRFVEAKVIGSDFIKIPVDVEVAEGRLIILDERMGPFLQSDSIFKLVPVQGRNASLFKHVCAVPKTDIVLVTVSNQTTCTTNLSATYFILSWNKLTAMYENFAFARDNRTDFSHPLPSYYCGIFASTSYVYYLSQTALHRFDLAEKNFKNIYSSQSLVIYSGSGDVQEFGNITEFYLFNRLWKSIDILQMIGDHVTQVRRVNLALLSPSLENLGDPAMSRYVTNSHYLLWDRDSTTIHLWNAKSNSCAQVVDLRSKKVRWIKIFGRQMFLVTTMGNQFCMEQINLISDRFWH